MTNPTAAHPRTEADNIAPAASAVRTYHNRFHGSRYIDKKNQIHEFIGGVFETSDPELIEELNKVTDIVGSPIFTKAPVITAEDRQPLSEVQSRAAQVMAQIAAAKQGQGQG